jgi:HAD superfamily hydrolase (TIGR01509 family)
MPLQALIFDIDGTFADTERDGHRVAFNAAFREAGLSWQWDAVLYGELLAVAGGKERIAHYAASMAPALAARADFEVLLRKLHALKTSHYVRLVGAGGVPLRPGIGRLVRSAREAGVRLAIATTTSPENVGALLRASLGAEALGWFEVVGAGDCVGAKKPAPDIYRWVIERLGLPAAACLALEDSANGLRAAQGAGVPCVITANDYTRGQDFSGALAVLPDLAATTLADLVALHSAA